MSECPHLLEEFEPVTSTIGYLETSVETAANEFVKWRSEVDPTTELVVNRIENTALPGMLALLDPLTAPPTRYLFAPTQSKWSAHFDNFRNGPDVAARLPVLSERIGCRGMRVTAVPNTINEKTGRGQYGAMILERYEPDRTMRSVCAINDGGRWEFGAYGPQLEIEDPSRYKATRVADRFNGSLLVEYLRRLGVNAFDLDFYDASGIAVLVAAEAMVEPPLYSASLASVRSAIGDWGE